MRKFPLSLFALDRAMSICTVPVTDRHFNQIGISITRGQVSHHGAALKLREDPRFTALVGRFGSKSTVLESDFGCNGYASRRATPQRVGIAALTSHQLMR
jgi:hypothetical protein